MKSFFTYIILLTSLIAVGACNGRTSLSGGDEDNEVVDNDGWLLPKDEIRDGGVGKDGIPSIDDPLFVPKEEIDFIVDDRLVVGILIDDEIRAYPHQVLDWHEIVNDKIGDTSFVLSYCPLTGTGMAWNAEIEGTSTEFGVSGLLFRNNLILYDRETDNRWSQMFMKSVKGTMSGKETQMIDVIETKWSTWIKMFPESDILRPNSSSTNGYKDYAYGKGYLTNDKDFVFPPNNIDQRLPSKERVHGIVFSSSLDGETPVRVYSTSQFTDTVTVINERYHDYDIVFAGNNEVELAESFYANIGDSTLTFKAVQDSLPIVMKDNEGNRWDVFGRAVSGPRLGERLKSTRSFTGYWFAWADIYEVGTCIYPEVVRCGRIDPGQ